MAAIEYIIPRNIRVLPMDEDIVEVSVSSGGAVVKYQDR